MASRKRLEDKNLKVLRELLTQSDNKKCFDCGQRGPTYVNMTIGCFVCTSCSGLLRGLNPPHRIKSISMASFNPQEIEFLQKHGNEVCRNIWLALWENSSNVGESGNDKMKDHLVHKYERKVWYSDQKPTPTAVSQVETPVAKPLQTLLGSNVQPVVVAPGAAGAAQKPAFTSTCNVSRMKPTKSNSNINMDFGSNFSNDFNSFNPSMSTTTFPEPAAEQKPAPLFDAFTSSEDSGNQDSFDLFVNSRPNQQSASNPTIFQQPASNTTLQNTTPTVSQVNNNSGVDKYAALADLHVNNTQSMFSSSSLFSSSPETCVRPPLNPFMSPSTNSNGADAFQHQQTKPANPFQSSAGAQPPVMTSQSSNMFYPPSVDTNNHGNNQTSMYGWDMSNTQMSFDRRGSGNAVVMTTSNPMVTSNQLNSNFLIGGGGTQQISGQHPSNVPNRSAMSQNSLVFPNQTTQGFATNFNSLPNQPHGQEQSQTFPRQQQQPVSQSLFQPQSSNQNQYSFSLGDTNNNQAVFNSPFQPFQPFHSDSNQFTKNPAIQDQSMFGTNNNTPVNNAPFKSTNPFM